MLHHPKADICKGKLHRKNGIKRERRIERRVRMNE